jgi:hypothetical protein
LVAFSCRGRSFCPSCEKKKQLLWAKWLREDVLLPVAHRHVVFTIPRLLRPLFRRRRELLGEPAQAGTEAVKELIRHASVEGDARPGIVVRASKYLQVTGRRRMRTRRGARDLACRGREPITRIRRRATSLPHTVPRRERRV